MTQAPPRTTSNNFRQAAASNGNGGNGNGGNGNNGHQQQAQAPAGQSAQAKPGALLMDLLAKAIPTLVTLGATEDQAKKLCRQTVIAWNKERRLQECSPESIVRATSRAAELELSIGGALPEAHILPFYNSKAQRLEAQLLIGYRGWVQMLYRGDMITVEVHAVYDGDEFQAVTGTSSDRGIRHVRQWARKDRGEPVGYYAIATFPDGRMTPEMMAVDEIEEVRLCSQQPDSGPWRDHYDEMAKKTVLLRISKKLPTTSPKLRRAMEFESEGFDFDKRETPAPAPAASSGRGVGALVGRLKGGGGGEPGQAPEPSKPLPQAQPEPSHGIAEEDIPF